jgi:hypothetical protein
VQPAAGLGSVMHTFDNLALAAKLALPAGLDAMGRTRGEIVDMRTDRAVAALRAA